MADKKECKVCKAGCKVKGFFEKDHTPLEIGLMVGCGFLAGIVIGVVTSPIRDGITIGSHNACDNNYGDNYDDFEDFDLDE